MLYDFFVAVVTLPYTLAVCAFNLAVSLAQAAVNLGLQIIGTLCALVASAVSAAETAVVNAFNAFVAWAIQFACDMFNALIAQPLQILKNEIVGWAMGLLSLIGTAVLTENNEGVSNASASLATYNFVINSDIFMILEFIGGALIAVLTTLMIMSGLGSEIVAITESALMKCLVSTIAGGLFSVAMFNGGVDVISGISQLLLGALGSDLSEGMAKVMGATMGTIGWLKSLVAAPILSNIVDFAIATIGFFLSYAGCLIHNQYWFGIDASLILDLFGLGFASYGVWDAFHMDDDAIEKIGVNGLSILKDVSLIEAGVSLFELTTTVTNDG
jgi:hypothetical protein